MFGLATWTKIAISIVSFGGAAGGTYFLKGVNSNISSEEKLSDKKDPEITPQAEDVGDQKKIIIGGSSKQQIEPRDQRNEGEVNQKSDVHTEGKETEKTSPLTETKNSVEETSEDISSEIPSTSTSSDGNSLRETDSLSVQGQLGNNVDYSREVSAASEISETSQQQTINQDDSSLRMQSDESRINNGNYSGRRSESKIFGEGNSPDSQISGEYMLLSGNSSNEGSMGNICSKITSGVGEYTTSEECQKMVNENLKESEEDKNNVRIWLKTGNKKHAEKILKVLEVNNSGDKWFDGENPIKVTFSIFGNLTCKLSEVNGEANNQEVTVSCLLATTDNLVETST
ncbi:hypothetical protein [Mycoplasma suis]|uniref:Uncharacterized protein n=1 Tax=Mycoplasma suis (strain Illinois) TaxID=768700 RepID=F0QQ70_MYCSL|nr:hypothetical protein [Mycoplasma suis]ADX97640.1 hypothetical protein MSU_0096 [Mycoplasma suis str. Illinois]